MNVIDVHEVQASVARLGVKICVGLPVLLLVMAVLMNPNFLADDGGTSSNGSTRSIGYIFIAVALADLITALILKKRLCDPKVLSAKFVWYPETFTHKLKSAYLTIFAICAAPAAYGLIYYFFLGGDIDTYVLITVICLLGYMLTRPRANEIERLAREVFKQAEDSDIRL